MILLFKILPIVVFLFFNGSLLLSSDNHIISNSGTTGKQTSLGGGSNKIIGSINGQDISFQKFFEKYENIKVNIEYAKKEKFDHIKAVKKAWDQLMTEVLIEQEFIIRDINIYSNEAIDSLTNNPMPQFKAIFMDDDGNFDKLLHDEVLKDPHNAMSFVKDQISADERVRLEKYFVQQRNFFVDHKMKSLKFKLLKSQLCNNTYGKKSDDCFDKWLKKMKGKAKLIDNSRNFFNKNNEPIYNPFLQEEATK